MRMSKARVLSGGLLCATALLFSACGGGKPDESKKALQEKTTLFKQRVENFLTQVKKTEDTTPKDNLAAVQKVLQAVRAIKADMTVQFDKLNGTMPEPFIDQGNQQLDELEAEFKKIPAR